VTDIGGGASQLEREDAPTARKPAQGRPTVRTAIVLQRPRRVRAGRRWGQPRNAPVPEPYRSVRELAASPTGASSEGQGGQREASLRYVPNLAGTSRYLHHGDIQEREIDPPPMMHPPFQPWRIGPGRSRCSSRRRWVDGKSVVRRVDDAFCRHQVYVERGADCLDCFNLPAATRE
jgi:hypothetical protein